ncbi:MAG: helix-turn-helix transcriptional regulator [Butyrivibrio sp.]|nr:helix-turn-helix transcriptional regulator [Butyrivibrio sp.]
MLSWCCSTKGVFMELISDKIFKLMEDKSMSIMEFSRKTGISHSTISDWKRKKTNPSADKILVICDVLGVSPYELLQDTYKPGVLQGKDYRIISEGTDSYKLVLEFEGLTPSNKERLFGYLQALKE